MKWMLTIYLCSVLDGSCIVINEEPYIYPKIYEKHSECVKDGLGESFEMLYGWKFKQEWIDEFEIYPKFICEKVPLPKKKPSTPA